MAATLTDLTPADVFAELHDMIEIIETDGHDLIVVCTHCNTVIAINPVSFDDVELYYQEIPALELVLLLRHVLPIPAGRTYEGVLAELKIMFLVNLAEEIDADSQPKLHIPFTYKWAGGVFSLISQPGGIENIFAKQREARRRKGTVDLVSASSAIGTFRFRGHPADG